MNTQSVGTATTTTSEQFGLVQNLVSTLSISNQPVQKELSEVVTEFRKFIEEIRQESKLKSEEISSLKAKVIQLESDKKELVQMHEAEKNANATSFEALTNLLEAQANSITQLQNQMSTLETKHTDLSSKYPSHKHHKNTPKHTHTSGPSN